MRPVRPLPAFAVLGLLLAVAACGDSDSDPDDGDKDASDGRDRGSRSSTRGSGPSEGVPPALDWSPDLAGGPQGKPCGPRVRCVGAGGDFVTITEAVNAARDGDAIQVAGGTYAEQVSVEGKQLTLLGGFDPDFTERDPAKNPTVVDAGGQGRTVVFSEAGDSVLDGFTVTGGKAPLDEYAEAVGSGILVYASGDVTISHNIVEGNDDGLDFTSCDCNTEGGGLYVDSYIKGSRVEIVGNIFRDNSAHRGAAIFLTVPAVIDGNLIEQNLGRGDHGGGMFLAGDGTVVRQNLVRGNEIGTQAGYGWGGGGIFAGNDQTKRPAITLENNRWVDNFAPGRGSGFFIDQAATGQIIGDLFHDNRCGENGAGFYIDGGAEHGSEAVLTHVTITGNTCPDGVNGSGFFAEGGSRIDLVDSIVAGNGGASDLWQCQDCQTPPPADPSVVSHSLVGPTHGSVDLGDGALDGRPRFADAKGGDFRLAEGSPGTGAAQDGTDLGAYGGAR